MFYVHHASGLDGRATGSYIDHLICRERKVELSGPPSGFVGGGGPVEVPNERLYYCQNWRADIVAMVSSAGMQVEQARYSTYGVPFGLPAGDVDSDGDVDATDLAFIDLWIMVSAYDVRADLDLDGDVDSVDRARTAAFSGTTLGRGVLTRASIANRFGYAGYAYDEPVLRYHVRNRVYDPYLGRWLTRDPIRYAAGTMSLYEYAASAALLFVDPFGLEPILDGIPFGPESQPLPFDPRSYPGYPSLQPIDWRDVRVPGYDNINDIPYQFPRPIPLPFPINVPPEQLLFPTNTKPADRLPAWLEWDGWVTNRVGEAIVWCCDVTGTSDHLASMSNGEVYAWGIGVPVCVGAGALGACELGYWGIEGGVVSVGSASAKCALHPPHAGGPHQFWHLQINWWRRGIPGSGRVLRFPWWRG